MEDQLSKKDKQTRDLILNGNMWKVMMAICIPLALYQSMAQIFRILDAKMAAHISSQALSAVSYLSQINSMIAAIGGGLAVGASLKISQAFGAGEYKLVKKRVSTLYALCLISGLAILAVIIPASDWFLQLVNTPQELIDIGKKYFIVDLISVVITFLNNVYMSVERARGNTKFIFYINMLVIIIKLVLTALCVYVLQGDVTTIAFASVIAQGTLLMVAIVRNIKHNDPFVFSLKSVVSEKTVVHPMIKISLPVIGEKVAFSFGKVIVNSMSTMYGALTVGALGVTNNIAGLTTSPQNGFQEGGAAIISQNIGAGKYERAIDAFVKIFIINMIIGVVGFAGSLLFLNQIAGLFAEGDLYFGSLIIHIYRYEAFGAIALGINVSVMALLYGYGWTKTAMVINFCRLFVFRIPVLWFLQQFTQIGSDSVGIVMMVSNISVALMSAVIGLYAVKKIRKRIKEKQKIITE